MQRTSKVIGICICALISANLTYYIPDAKAVIQAKKRAWNPVSQAEKDLLRRLFVDGAGTETVTSAAVDEAKLLLPESDVIWQSYLKIGGGEMGAKSRIRSAIRRRNFSFRASCFTTMRE
jgi:hypothetical protein